MADDWLDIGGAEDFAEGVTRVVEVAGRELLVVRTGDALHAIDNVCTHDGEELSGGAVEDGEIVCPRHGARFCLKTGAALTPPAYEPVATHAVRVAAGRVSIRREP